MLMDIKSTKHIKCQKAYAATNEDIRQIWKRDQHVIMQAELLIPFKSKTLILRIQIIRCNTGGGDI